MFVSSGPQLMRTKLKIHCAARVCAPELAQKEETKIESLGSAKAQTQTPPTPLLFSSFSSFYLCVPLSRSGVLWPVQMKCGPHAGPRRRGSRGCFFAVLEPRCASFNLMFQCKFFFHNLSSPHVCNMAGFTLQPLCHYGYQGKAECTLAKEVLYSLFILLPYIHYGCTPRGTRERRL